ncbi:MAG: CocE/NonD family hydrolase [Alphaproteobacteria bacterium]|nr:CocE/NonD family hydrolase [Alphaproteobacteria bacterium]
MRFAHSPTPKRNHNGAGKPVERSPMNIPGASDMVVDRDIGVLARDGVALATDVYRPVGGGSFPVLLERTPYDKSAPSRSERTAAVAQPRTRAEVAQYFVSHGYAVVYQDCRGRYKSGGRFTKYLSEAEDGYDCLAWLVRQSWCNGRIGTFGLSYAAHTQAALASLDPPGLAAQFLDCGGFSNAYRSGIRHGGAFDLKQATWAYNNALADARDPEVKAALKAQDIKEWFARMPWRKGASPLSAAPDYEDYLFEQWSHGTFDDFWKQPGIYAEGYYDRSADVPVVNLSGWYDPYARTAMENYAGLSLRKRGPVHLILGPWTHGDRSLSYSGDVDFGPAAPVDGNLAEDFFALRRRWFDRWVRGVADGAELDPAVRIFVMGGGSGRHNAAGRLDHGGRWRTATDWPLPQTEWTKFFLRSNRALSREMPDGTARPLDYVSDPRNPVPTIGGALSSGEPVMRSGAYDQRELTGRTDVLTFSTAPLERDLEVTGPVTARLWIASDGPDTDFTAKLIDVYPPNKDYPHGFAMNLTEGILRCRYRDSWERPSLMVPGEIYAITIELFPTGNLFRRGHRLRLDIASSNFPHFDINANSGEDEGKMEHPRLAHNRVFIDAARPSHLILPIIPSWA